MLKELFASSTKNSVVPLTKSDVRKDYTEQPSFTNLLPWREYDAENKVFLLEDGKGVGALFEIEQVGVEAKPESYIREVQEKLQSTITETIPEDGISPWTLQFYVQDELSVRTLTDQIKEYAADRAAGTPYTQHFLKVMDEHLRQVGQPNGLFNDEVVTGGRWQGKRRVVRMCLYRYFPENRKANYDRDVRELGRIRKRLMTQFTGIGIKAKIAGGKELYEWMLRWLNPNPVLTKGDSEELLKAAPYPGDEDLAYGYDLAEQMLLTRPESDADKGIWYFDGMPHTAVSVQALRRVPKNGLFTAERNAGEHTFAMFDRMPEGTVMSMTIEIKPRDEVLNHLSRIMRSAVGDNAEAEIAQQEAKIAQHEQARNNTLYPVYISFLTRAKDAEKLDDAVSVIESLLLSNNLMPIAENQDLLKQDMYIRSLPMKFDSLMVSKKQRRSRLVFSRQIASMLPVYGRSKGTDNPGLMYFNRGGEPLLVDPLNSSDRKKNAHALIVGPTGAGKSASLVDAVMKIAAVHRPRIFIVEAGDSFGLLGEYMKKHGLTVNQMSVQPSADISLPPFANAMKLLELDENDIEATDYDEEVDLDDEDEDRDYLGEMELAARVMITGGEKKEDDLLHRADRLVIRKAIYRAAQAVKDSGRKQVITEDVVNALRVTEDLDVNRTARSIEMADAMELYCTGLEGKLFNRTGEEWKDADITIFDMGILAREGYEDKLTVAYMSLMNHVHALVEREQHEGRPTLMLTDEGHIITKNAILAPYIIKIVKMWRKLGAWYWIATQNLEDFPDDSRRMLTMLEWWICLVMPKDEVTQIARFKDLSPEQESKLMAAQKSPGQYTEGVILTDTLDPLFRAIPPAIALSLAMTEQHEKAERREIMEATGCDRVEAAEAVAEKIKEARRKHSLEEAHV